LRITRITRGGAREPTGDTARASLLVTGDTTAVTGDTTAVTAVSTAVTAVSTAVTAVSIAP